MSIAPQVEPAAPPGHIPAGSPGATPVTPDRLRRPRLGPRTVRQRETQPLPSLPAQLAKSAVSMPLPAIVLPALAVAALIIALSWALIATQSNNDALSSEVARLRGDVTSATSREQGVQELTANQQQQLATQDAQLAAQEQELSGVGQDLDELKLRIGRLDQHNAELRQALGLADDSGLEVTATPTITGTPESAIPNGAILAQGGEVGPLLDFSAADRLASYRSEIARLNYILPAYESEEADLIFAAEQLLAQWNTAQDEQPVEDELPTPAPTATPAPEPTLAPTATAPPTAEPATPTATPKPKLPGKAPSGLPYYGIITSPYGMRASPFVKGKVGFHKGVDIGAPEGTAVKATQAGVITVAGWTDTYGETVMIDHGSGWSTVYGHNSKLLVKIGDYVEKGQIISRSGNTGPSTGPHIHYEVRRNGETRNPLDYK